MKLWMMLFLLIGCADHENRGDRAAQSQTGPVESEDQASTEPEQTEESIVENKDKKDDDSKAEATCSPILEPSKGSPTKSGDAVISLEIKETIAARVYHNAQLIFADKGRCPANKVGAISINVIMACCGSPSDMSQLKIVRASGKAHEFNLSGLRFNSGGTWKVQISAEVNDQNENVEFEFKAP